MNKVIRFLAIVAVTGIGFQNSLSAQDAGTIQTIKIRVVEDGGTGAYPAIMYTDTSLATHTIFRPEDLSVFGKKYRS